MYASATLLPIGTDDMCSTPAAITTSCVPLITACAAKWIACCDEPHWRSTAVPGTCSGMRREERIMLRPTLPACPPLCETHPTMTSSIMPACAAEIPVCSTSASSTAAPIVIGCHSRLEEEEVTVAEAEAEAEAEEHVCRVWVSVVCGGEGRRWDGGG